MKTWAVAFVAAGLSLGSLAWADEVPNLTDAPRAAHLQLPPTAARTGLMMLVESVALLGAGACSYLVGSSWAIADFNANGRPDPQVVAGSFAVSLALNLAIVWLVLPELARITNDDQGTVDVSAIRLQAWRTSRWVALAGMVFVAILAAGAVREHAEFGRGQSMMMVGLVGASASVITFDVTALFAARQALSANRHPTEPAP